MNVEGAVSFLKSLKGRKVAVVSHDDSDGSCSAALIIRLLRKICRNCKVSYFSTHGTPAITDDLMKDILEEKPDAVITCDFAGGLDESAKMLVKNNIKCLMIDHHVPREYMFPEECVYANPQLSGKTMPCCAFVYDICNKITDSEENLWIACVGTIEDYGACDRKDIIEACMKKYPELFEKKKIDNAQLFDTSFGLVGKIIGTAPTWASWQGAELATKVLLEIDSPRDFLGLENDHVRMMYEKFGVVEREVKKVTKMFEKENKVDGRVRTFSFSSDYGIKSKVSTIVSSGYEKDVVAIIEENNKYASVSFRNQSGDFDLNSIIGQCLSGLEGKGGGHRKAAGAVVLIKDFPVFMDRFKKKVNG
ncbi:MAG: DHHA1 domain-containing protein [archaeon]|nr:DHHA1 domain-containing protein [archaeon]